VLGNGPNFLPDTQLPRHNPTDENKKDKNVKTKTKRVEDKRP